LLNASVMYGGIALGGVIGGLAISQLDTAAFGWIGASFPLAAMTFSHLDATGRRQAPAAGR